MTTVTLDRPTDAVEAEEVEAPIEPVEITFDADRLPMLEAELARLNKIADRLNVERLTYTETARGTREKKVDDDIFWGRYKTIEIETITVVINGTTPRLPGGWKFLGSVEFLPDAEDGTKLSLVHGDDERLAPYREAGPVCDHCGYRRNRRKIVVLVDDDDHLTVVGSKCLKDFLGYHADPEKVLRFYDSLADMLGELDDDDDGIGGRFARSPDLVPAEPFLAMAAAMVRIYGWVPKSSYDGTPTAGRVGERFFPPNLGKNATKEEREELAELLAIEPSDEDAERAKLIKSWAGTAFAENPLSNYLGNLATVLAGSWVNLRHFGIATSAVGAYDKAMGKEIIRKKNADAAAASEWVGTPGKREVFTGTVTAVIPYDTMYGTGRVVKMLDADGNVLKSLTSGAWAYGLNVGDEVTVKATVKSHDIWNNGKETNLTRAALVKG
jgi:hypothetical protein